MKEGGGLGCGKMFGVRGEEVKRWLLLSLLRWFSETEDL